MSLDDKLGRRIKQLRKREGLTQETLAYTSESGIGSKGYLSDIEAGKRIPSVRALAALAERLDVPVFDLLVFPEDGLRQRVVDGTRGASEDVLREIEALLTKAARK